MIVVGGGWKAGKGFVEAWWETTNGGAMDHAPLAL